MTVDSMALFLAKGDLAELERLLDLGCDPNVVAPDIGTTPLYGACFMNQAAVVRLLLSRGADPNQRLTYRSPVDGRIEKGLVALMLAQSPEVVAALLDAGADPNARDEAGRTPLMRAALSATLEAVAVLLKAGADPAARSRAGTTAADLVRNRLDWLRETWSSLKQPAGEQRKQKLERMLALLEPPGA